MTRDEHVAALAAVLRDIPGDAVLGGPSYPIPGELTRALAVHLYETGARITEAPTRYWQPPDTEIQHYLVPGEWKQIMPEVGTDGDES